MIVSDKTDKIIERVIPYIDDLNNTGYVFLNGEVCNKNNYNSRYFDRDTKSLYRSINSIIVSSTPKNESVIIPKESHHIYRGDKYYYESVIKNQVAYSDKYNTGIFFIESGSDSDLIFVSFNDGYVKSISNYLNSSYANKHGEIEILCESEEFFYITVPSLVSSKSGSTNYTDLIDMTIRTVGKKHGNVNTVYNNNYGGYGVLVTTIENKTKYRKIFEDDDVCYIAYLSRIYGSDSGKRKDVVRVVKINKKNDSIDSMVLEVGEADSYISKFSKPSDGFLIGDYLCFYYGYKDDVYLFKIEKNPNKELSIRNIENIKTNIIDKNLPRHATKFTYMVKTDCSGSIYLSLIDYLGCKNRSSATGIYRYFVTYKTSDYVNFEMVDEKESKDGVTPRCVIEVNNNILIAFDDKVEFYIFENGSYKLSKVEKYNSITMIGITDNNIFVQDYDGIKTFNADEEAYIKTYFNKDIEHLYLNIETNAKDLLSIETTLKNCIFEDGSSSKIIDVSKKTKIKVITKTNGIVKAIPKLIKNKGVK